MAKKVIMVGDATSLLLGTQRPFGGRVSGVGATTAPWAWVQGVGMYTVQSGDTLSGIAAKYLGDWSEYRYIWQAQDDAYRTLRGKPENIRAGDRLVMPDAASDKAVALNLLGPRPPPAADDKSVVYTMPETIIYGDGSEATTAPLTVDPAMQPGVVKPVPAPWSLSDFVDNLKPWQKYAALGALFLGAAGTAVVVVKAKKQKKRPAALVKRNPAPRRKRKKARRR
jgi:murein DD-endopeptidase MepM/ murein hydrolase activator NlpD